MLLPPQELISLAAITREIENCKVYLVDSIAEGFNTLETIEKLMEINPSVIVSIQGFECFEEDMITLSDLKQALPTVTQVLFGHYATLFPQEILVKTPIDIIVLGEPDNIFGELILAIKNNQELSSVEGIAYKANGVVVIKEGDSRIPHPEFLPMPAYDLLTPDKYYEPFLKGPFGLIQSARGCPYSCNYCVRSFGKRLTYRTSDQIIDEILFLKRNFGINSLRFIDDTFTVHTKRVIEICQKIIDKNIKIEWTCLSRVDTLRPEMVPIMKKAGCKRIYFGVESGSVKTLKYLNKNINLKDSLDVLRLCKKYRIETLGFFIVGVPNETNEDFLESVEFAIKADFDYITVNQLIPYPGTELFDDLKEEINFSLLPYKNEWKNAELKNRNSIREKKFYRMFYFRPRYFLKSIQRIMNHPIDFLQNFSKLSNYLFKKKKQQKNNYF